MTILLVASLEDFNKIIGSGKPVVIEFYATWCRNCKPMLPIFETLAQDVPGIEFYKVDIDLQPLISQRNEIEALPGFILFKGGVKVSGCSGADPHAVLTLIREAERLV